MTRGLLLAGDGVADTQLEYAYHRLREDAVIVDVASPNGGSVRSDRGRTRLTHAVTALPRGRRYDLVVVPGGDGAALLADDGAARRWLADYLGGGGVVCAVAEGVELLLEVGALEGRLATGPASARAAMAAAGAEPTDEAVTVDGTIVTVRDTDALPFGVAAALGSVAIPQDPASRARERPVWGGSDE